MRHLKLYEDFDTGAVEAYYRQLRQDGKTSGESVREVMKKFGISQEDALDACMDAMQVTEAARERKMTRRWAR